jgi:hypothetical protein
LVEDFHRWHFLFAWAAPGSPEIEKNDFSFKNFQVNFFAFEIFEAEARERSVPFDGLDVYLGTEATCLCVACEQEKGHDNTD